MFRQIRRGLAIFHVKKLLGLVVRLFIVALIFGIGLSGCFESGGAGSGNSESAEVVIGLTDAESDFVKYEVVVDSLTLTKQNGALVDVLPVETRVDFAQYVEMTEFLTAATIPVGRYVKATLGLDYTNADIQVERADGSAVQVHPSNVHDDSGSQVNRISVSVHLQGRNSLVIARGIPAHLTLDFDLAASNHVDLSDPNSPELTLKPCLIAEVNPENSKIHRLRGPLKTVNTAEGIFRIIIRPFIHVIASGDERFGTLKVVTNSSTVYDINGDKYQGSAGLGALDQQQVLTAVVVIGDLNIATRRFEATQVYAGSSVPGGTLDVVTGNVISRSGNQLTVRGATLIRAGGSVVFNDQVDVQLGDGTTVSRQLSKELFSKDDISVGQRIMVFGELNSSDTQLDATAGHVGMLLTTIKGNVVSTGGSVVVNLTAVDGRTITLFDFSDTGIDAANDADPTAYEVDIGRLDTSGLDGGTPVKLRGFVTPFGHPANTADFEAQTLVNVSEVKGLMIASWEPPSSDAITDLSAGNFALNLNGAGLFHHLNRAGVVTDLTGLADAPIIEPQEGDNGLFQLVQGGSRQFFFTYAGFIEELTERLENSDITHIIATGIFDDDNSILTMDSVIVGLK